MKKVIVILMITALAAGAAFARGNSEDNNGNRQGSGLRSDAETVVISGTVEELDGQVVLRSAGKLYSMSAPGFYREGVDIPFGETVEVTGSLIDETCGDCDISADGHLFVASAVFAGGEFNFETGRNGAGREEMARAGGRRGMAGNAAGSGNGSRRGGGARQGGGRRVDAS